MECNKEVVVMCEEKTLEEVCVWKECATNQRKTELESGLTSKGTQHYEKVGCYACNGQNKKCLAYTIPYKVIE